MGEPFLTLPLSLRDSSDEGSTEFGAFRVGLFPLSLPLLAHIVIPSRHSEATQE